MLKIKIVVGGDSFQFKGAVPFAEVRPLLDLWFALLDHAAERPPRVVFSVGPVSEQGA